jgi:hypothetical protein
MRWEQAQVTEKKLAFVREQVRIQGNRNPGVRFVHADGGFGGRLLD